MSRAMGVTDHELSELPRWRDSDAFDELDKLALELAEAMTANPADVTDDLRHRLRLRLTDAQLTELVANIAWENHRTRLNRALDVRAMGFSDGAYCVVPDH